MELWKQLHKHRTATVIEQTWRYYLHPIIDTPLGGSIVEGLTLAYGELAMLLEQAVEEQTQIGWDKLLLGMGTKTWRIIQEFIDVANPKAP
mmetsp:Transcript_1975/g.3033  ORF Transcript_1975/g.3033 Transcript_1975/m.3033 type:complete len:91 (-) Transcript_1975:578-850(-)